MHLSRLMLTGTTVLALSLATGCSEDKPEEKADAEPTKSPSAATQVASESRDCGVRLTVQGAEQTDLRVKGEVRIKKGPSSAVYAAEKGDVRVSVYSAGGDVSASVNLFVGDAAYYTPPGDSTGIDASRRGKRATVDVSAVPAGGGEPAHIVATFTC